MFLVFVLFAWLWEPWLFYHVVNSSNSLTLHPSLPPSLPSFAVNKQRTIHDQSRKAIEKLVHELDELVRESLPTIGRHIDEQLFQRLWKLETMMGEFSDLESIIKEVTQAGGQGAGGGSSVMGAVVAGGGGGGGELDGGAAGNRGRGIDEGGAGGVRGVASNGHGSLVHGASLCQIVPNSLDDDGNRTGRGGYASRPSIFASPGGSGHSSSPSRFRPARTDEQQQQMQQQQQPRPPKPEYERKRIPQGANYQLADSALPAPHSNDLPHNPRLAVIVSRRVQTQPNGPVTALVGVGEGLCRWKPPPAGAGLPSMAEVQALLGQFDRKYEEHLLWAIYEGGWELSLTRIRFHKKLNTKEPLLDKDEMGKPIPLVERFTASDVLNFERAMSEKWKDFYWASRFVRKSTKSCIAFYYNEWKKTPTYKRLKPVRVPVPAETDEVEEEG